MPAKGVNRETHAVLVDDDLSWGFFVAAKHSGKRDAPAHVGELERRDREAKRQAAGQERRLRELRKQAKPVTLGDLDRAMRMTLAEGMSESSAQAAKSSYARTAISSSPSRQARMDGAARSQPFRCSTRRRALSPTACARGRSCRTPSRCRPGRSPNDRGGEASCPAAPGRPARPSRTAPTRTGNRASAGEARTPTRPTPRRHAEPARVLYHGPWFWRDRTRVRRV
jgi:hypothetical protein